MGSAVGSGSGPGCGDSVRQLKQPLFQCLHEILILELLQIVQDGLNDFPPESSALLSKV